MKSKKKKRKTKRLQIELSGIPRISDRHEVTVEDIDNIQGTLNAISSRVDDIWNYLSEPRVSVFRAGNRETSEKRRKKHK